MYMAGLSGTICTLSIKQLPGWLLDQTHTRCSWVQWPVDLPSCTSWAAMGHWFHWAVQWPLQLQSVAEQWHEHYTFLPAWSLILFSLLSKLVHEILSQNGVVIPKAFLSRNCPTGKPRECCRSSGPAVWHFAWQQEHMFSNTLSSSRAVWCAI